MRPEADSPAVNKSQVCIRIYCAICTDMTMKKEYTMPSIDIYTLQSAKTFTTSDKEDGLDFDAEESGE